MVSSRSEVSQRLGRFCLMSVAAVALTISPSPVGAQEATQEAADEAPSISLGEISGSPGASLMIPLYYKADADLPIKALTIEVDFVSNNLKFQRVAKGLAAEAAGAEVTAKLTEGTPDAQDVTRSKLEVTSSVEGNKTLEGGLLAYLLYDISLDAKPRAITLNTSILSADGPNAPQNVASIKANPGVVVVEVLDVMPEATCFFFTH